MTQERSSVYRGETREIAEAAYHADARAMARMGYAPTSEDWDVEEVLIVRYVHAPELSAAVLDAVASAEAERPVAPRSARVARLQQSLGHGLRRALAHFDRLTTELKVTVGAIAGLAAGIAVWLLLGLLVFGHDPIMLFVSLFTLGFAGGSAGALMTLRRELRRG